MKDPSSDKVRSELQQIFWKLRVHTQAFKQCAYDKWLKWEILCSESWKNCGPSRRDNFQFEYNTPPQKPIVLLLDDKLRCIEVSLPIESSIGEIFVGMRVVASCKSDEELTIARVSSDAIEKCLIEGGEKVMDKAFLPHDDIWEVAWYGEKCQKSQTVETLRLAKAIVDLTIYVTELQKQVLDVIEALDELARKCAGDIHGVLQKLRGPCSSKMGTDIKFPMLDSEVSSGQSILKVFRSIVQSNDMDKESIPGITRLVKALATANPVHIQLEDAAKTRSKKGSVKRFKSHLTALIKSGQSQSGSRM